MEVGGGDRGETGREATFRWGWVVEDRARGFLQAVWGGIGRAGGGTWVAPRTFWYSEGAWTGAGVTQYTCAINPHMCEIAPLRLLPAVYTCTTPVWGARSWRELCT